MTGSDEELEDVSIVAIVGVCDECELIEKCIAHLESLGVTIVVVDTGSEDGTLDILQRYADEGQIHMVPYVPARDCGLYYLDVAFQYAKTRFRPDWVFFQDADEFWCPILPLRHLLAEKAPCAIVVERYNACVTPYLLAALVDDGGAVLDPVALDVHVGGKVLESSLMREAAPPAWISGRDAGKVLVAADLVASVGKAAHWIFGHGKVPLILERSDSIAVVHVPVSSIARFRRKIRNAEILLLTSLDTFPGETAWHWKRWVELARAGRIHEEYELQFTDPAALPRLRLEGKVATASTLLSAGSAEDARQCQS